MAINFEKKTIEGNNVDWTNIDKNSETADHGRADWLGYWDEFVQKAQFKKLVCLHHIKQNNLTYLGQVCTPSLSVFTGIYGETNVGINNSIIRWTNIERYGCTNVDTNQSQNG